MHRKMTDLLKLIARYELVHPLWIERILIGTVVAKWFSKRSVWIVRIAVFPLIELLIHVSHMIKCVFYSNFLFPYGINKQKCRHYNNFVTTPDRTVSRMNGKYYIGILVFKFISKGSLKTKKYDAEWKFWRATAYQS